MEFVSPYNPQGDWWLSVTTDHAPRVIFEPHSDVTIGWSPKCSYRLPWTWGILAHPLINRGTIVNMMRRMSVSMGPGFDRDVLREPGKSFRARALHVALSSSMQHADRTSKFPQLDIGITYASTEDGLLRGEGTRWWALDYQRPLEVADPLRDMWLQVLVHYKASADAPLQSCMENFAPRSSVGIGLDPECHARLSKDAETGSHLLISEGTLIHPPLAICSIELLRVDDGVTGTFKTLGPAFCARVPELHLGLPFKRTMRLRYAPTREALTRQPPPPEDYWWAYR